MQCDSLVLHRFHCRFVCPLYLNKTNKIEAIPMSLWCRKSFEMDSSMRRSECSKYSWIFMLQTGRPSNYHYLGLRTVCILKRTTVSVCYYSCINVHSYVYIQSTFPMGIVKISVRVCSRDREHEGARERERESVRL